jgi:hypothetical protein
MYYNHKKSISKTFYKREIKHIITGDSGIHWWSGMRVMCLPKEILVRFFRELMTDWELYSCFGDLISCPGGEEEYGGYIPSTYDIYIGGITGMC